MTIHLTLTQNFYTEAEKVPYEALGFQFELAEFSTGGLLPAPEPIYREINNPTIELTTLEELFAFAKRYGKLILTATELDFQTGDRVDHPAIEIYNYWRE